MPDITIGYHYARASAARSVCVCLCVHVCLRDRCRLHYHDKEAPRLNGTRGLKGVLENGWQTHLLGQSGKVQLKSNLNSPKLLETEMMVILQLFCIFHFSKQLHYILELSMF